MNDALRKFIRGALPEPVLQEIKKLRDTVRPLELTGPVAQMYINDADIRSHLNFNNFMSFLKASVASKGIMAITLYDRDGQQLHTEFKELSHFASCNIDIGALLEHAASTSSLGLVTLSFKPAKPRTASYKAFGWVSAQFFMFYQGSGGSVAMVHPSSVLEPISEPGRPFVSNQIVDTAGLESVVLYQCNPSHAACELVLGLRDAITTKDLTSQMISLPPLSTRKVEFDVSAPHLTGRSLRVFASSLPTLNSKPMLCRRYPGNRFSMSHS